MAGLLSAKLISALARGLLLQAESAALVTAALAIGFSQIEPDALEKGFWQELVSSAWQLVHEQISATTPFVGCAFPSEVVAPTEASAQRKQKLEVAQRSLEYQGPVGLPTGALALEPFL